MSDWIKIADRLPDEGNPVIATDGKNMVLVTLEFNEHMPYWWEPSGVFGEYGYGVFPQFESEFYKGSVTHWMPLPELPKADKE